MPKLRIYDVKIESRASSSGGWKYPSFGGSRFFPTTDFFLGGGGQTRAVGIRHPTLFGVVHSSSTFIFYRQLKSDTENNRIEFQIGWCLNRQMDLHIKKKVFKIRNVKGSGGGRLDRWSAWVFFIWIVWWVWMTAREGVGWHLRGC
jgi:hypothetical protein